MSDLVIGTKRPSTPRTVRGVAIATLVVLVALMVTYFIYQRVVSYAMPGGSVSGSPLLVDSIESGLIDAKLSFDDSAMSYSGRITVLQLVGDPHTLGASQGRLLGDSVSDVSRSVSPTIEHIVSKSGMFGATTYQARLRWRLRHLDNGIPGHQLKETAGVVRGTRRTAGDAPSYESFVRQQAFLDIGAAVPWSSGHAFRAVARSLSFVTTLRNVRGDRLIVGRSFGLPGTADGGEATAKRVVVSFVHPKGVTPYATVAWPGMVGVVSGINAHKIAVMVHPVRTADIKVSRKAQPIALLARDILENAHTLDEAIKILEHNEPLGAAAFVIVDGNARQWAVVDRSPGQVAVTRKPRVRVVTDLLRGEAFKDDAENDRARRTRPSLMRARRTAKLLRAQAPKTPLEAVAILRDAKAVDGSQLPLGHRAAVQDLSASHTALFDASAMVLWVCEGPGASGRFRAFDLKHFLRKEGAPPTAPADLPADKDFDASAGRAVLEARAYLRKARRLWRDGERRRPRELVQRALARSPDLPEALRMAGDYARKRKDRKTAHKYYQRYLQRGPDDLAAAEEIKALLRN